MMMALMCVGFASCGGDDNDSSDSKPSGSSIVGNWYKENTPYDFVAFKEQMVEGINESLQQNPQLQKSDFFQSDGRLIFPKNNYAFGGTIGIYVHIIDNNTLSISDFGTDACAIGGSYTNGKDLVAIIKTGTIVGEVGLYSTPNYYTYEIIDNKLYVPLAGAIFTISGTNLLRDGGGVYKNFTSGQRY